MSFKLATAESFSFDGESFGTSGANALRKVKSLAELAPTGRLFASIATLVDVGNAATSALEKNQLDKATTLANQLNDLSEVKMPTYFRRKA
jgi:hypothetical protein